MLHFNERATIVSRELATKVATSMCSEDDEGAIWISDLVEQERILTYIKRPITNTQIIPIPNNTIKTTSERTRTSPKSRTLKNPANEGNGMPKIMPVTRE